MVKFHRILMSIIHNIDEFKRSSCFIMLAHIVLLAVILADPVDCKRAKRIVGGWQILDRDPTFMPYNNVRYFAWIENGHSCDLSPSWWERFPTRLLSGWCKPRTSTLKCGGALITPQIIQTACHCAADFMKVSGARKTWKPAVARHAWTVGYSVYLGLNNIHDFQRFKLQVWAMWVHPKCAELSFSPRYVTHDIGWMQLDFKVQDHFVNYQGYHMGYAPLYNTATIERLFRETVAKELVCLVIGFGKVRETDTVGSSVMKHTWMQVVYSDLCYWYTSVWRNLTNKFDWNTYNSWVCGVPFNKFFNDGFNAAGDSGSPVTCDNNYFAVVSSHKVHVLWIRAGLKIVMMQDPIKYALKENAAEYRAAFIELVENRDWKFEIDDELRALSQSQYNELFRVQRLSKAKNVTSSESSGQPSLSWLTHTTTTSKHCSASLFSISCMISFSHLLFF